MAINSHFEFIDRGIPGDRDVDLNLTSKEVTGKNAPVGAALVAQAMNGGDVSMRYKAM